MENSKFSLLPYWICVISCCYCFFVCLQCVVWQIHFSPNKIGSNARRFMKRIAVLDLTINIFRNCTHDENKDNSFFCSSRIIQFSTYGVFGECRNTRKIFQREFPFCTVEQELNKKNIIMSAMQIGIRPGIQSACLEYKIEMALQYFTLIQKKGASSLCLNIYCFYQAPMHHFLWWNSLKMKNCSELPKKPWGLYKGIMCPFLVDQCQSHVLARFS